MEANRKRHKQKSAIPHHRQMTDFCLSWGSDLRLDCKKKKKNNNHSLVERERERHSKSNELLQNKREKKERGLALLSLSLYRLSNDLLFTTGAPRGS